MQNYFIIEIHLFSSILYLIIGKFLSLMYSFLCILDSKLLSDITDKAFLHNIGSLFTWMMAFFSVQSFLVLWGHIYIFLLLSPELLLFVPQSPFLWHWVHVLYFVRFHFQCVYFDVSTMQFRLLSLFWGHNIHMGPCAHVSGRCFQGSWDRVQ